MTAQKNTDPEAWLADQLAQVDGGEPCAPVPDGAVLIPGSRLFEAVQKLAQEYGEMCAARAIADFEDLTIATRDEDGLHVLVGGNEVKPLDEVFPTKAAAAMREMGAGPLAVTHGLDDEVVR